MKHTNTARKYFELMRTKAGYSRDEIKSWLRNQGFIKKSTKELSTKQLFEIADTLRLEKEALPESMLSADEELC